MIKLLIATLTTTLVTTSVFALGKKPSGDIVSPAPTTPTTPTPAPTQPTQPTTPAPKPPTPTPSQPTPPKPPAAQPPINGRPSHLAPYNYVDPQGIVPSKPLITALSYYDKYYSQLSNKKYITVIDFTQKSSNKRMYVIDMKTGSVTRYLTSHGKGSDPSHTGYAQKFSNTPGSNMSSLGMYITSSEYQGKHGRSMRLNGIESSNNNARSRAIVVHGAWYVDPKYNPLGRSEGCPAVETKYIDSLVTQLKEGSVYYIWAGQ